MGEKGAAAGFVKQLVMGDRFRVVFLGTEITMRKPVLFSLIPSASLPTQTAQVLINHKDLFSLYWYAGDATGVASPTCKGDAYVLCFNPNERSSFYELSLFRDKILSFDSKAVILILELEEEATITIPPENGRVGAGGSSINDRVVSEKRVKKLAEEFGCPFLKHFTPIHPEVRFKTSSPCSLLLLFNYYLYRSSVVYSQKWSYASKNRSPTNLQRPFVVWFLRF